MARRTEPVRTCVGCRTRAARSDLVRMVAVDGELIPDVRHRMPGRGAYLHPDLACFELAERRRAFPRALRVPGLLGLGRARAYVVEQRMLEGQWNDGASRDVGKPVEDRTTSPDVDTEAGRDSDDRAMSTQP